MEHGSHPNGAPTWSRLEPWQLSQLQRLAKFDPERVETILNTLWAMYPTLRAELGIAAVEQHELTVAEAAHQLELSEGEVEKRLAVHRKALSEWGQAHIAVTPRGAQVEDSQVFVWEIVREYRKLGSVDRLTEAFPGLTVGQLGSAMNYARDHAQEIEDAITAYEEMQAKKREAYPYA